MKFNKKAQSAPTQTHNLAGGQAYKESAKLELVSILLTSFVKNQFYRGQDDTVERVKELISQIKDKTFAAKAAIYARTKFGMRSISHVVAGELFREQAVTGQPWVKQFINQVVYRPDDALEIMSYFKANVMTNSIPNQLRKGLSAALSKFNAYSLAKYRGENKEFKMVDVMNLVHPKSTEALDKLAEGTLKNTNTFESKLSAAGQNAESEEEKAELKSEAWADLILEKKIGYFALLRNLRNIIEQASDEVLLAALNLLCDKELIRKSLVLPFRYLTAIEEIQKIGGVKGRAALGAINKAIDIATANVPRFSGLTAIVVDESGSMTGKPHDIAGLFAGILFKANPGADVYKFSNNCGVLNGLNPADSTLTLAQQIKQDCGTGGGTDFHSIFRSLTKAYDRIIILSDMQGWVGYDTPAKTFGDYRRRTGSNPRVYSFDLAGYGTLQFPENNVYAIAGFSEKVFDLMKMLEEDRNALIHAIEAIQFEPLPIVVKTPVRKLGFKKKPVRSLAKLKKAKKPTRK